VLFFVNKNFIHKNDFFDYIPTMKENKKSEGKKPAQRKN